MLPRRARRGPVPEPPSCKKKTAVPSEVDESACWAGKNRQPGLPLRPEGGGPTGRLETGSQNAEPGATAAAVAVVRRWVLVRRRPVISAAAAGSSRPRSGAALVRGMMVRDP